MNSPTITLVRKGHLWHYCNRRNVRWMNDGRVTQYLSFRGKFTMWSGFNYWLQHTRNQDMLLAIYYGSMHVGNCGFFGLNERSAELRISIGEPSVWGKGIGSIAVKQMLELAASAGIGIVWLNVHPDNGAAVRIYEKNGFVHMGAVTLEDSLTQLRMVCQLNEQVAESGGDN